MKRLQFSIILAILFLIKATYAIAITKPIISTIPTSQEPDFNELAKQRISKIKKSTGYFYDQASLDDSTQAVAVAEEFLFATIKSACSREFLILTVEREDIKKQYKIISYEDGEKTNVFAYIERYKVCMKIPESMSITESDRVNAKTQRTAYDANNVDKPFTANEIFYEFLRDLSKTSSINDVMQLLESQRYNGLFISGLLNEEVVNEGVFNAILVVYDEEGVRAVMSPRTPSRINLKTFYEDSIANYPGCWVRWVRSSPSL